jgi:hypothetical protein
LPVIFIFASLDGLQQLKKYRDWSIDGTFFSAPKNFTQLFTLNVFVGKSTAPCVYFLLPDKKGATYKRALATLHAKVPGLDPTSIMSGKPIISSIMKAIKYLLYQFICLDFEHAPVSILEKLYPNCTINLCLFHLAKSCYTNVQKWGLIPAYRDASVRENFRCLPALAFLPSNEVEDGFDEVAAELRRLVISDALDGYLNYFEKTYARKKEFGLSCDPLFPVEKWNCNAAALKKLPRTNNAQEGWHRRFNGRFPRAKMNLSQFITRMKEEEEATALLFENREANPASPFRGRESRIAILEREDQIETAVRDYRDGKYRSRIHFLVCIQNHLASSF